MSGFEPLQALSPVRELRADQDLALMRPSEVLRFFGRQPVTRAASAAASPSMPAVQPTILSPDIVPVGGNTWVQTRSLLPLGPSSAVPAPAGSDLINSSTSRSEPSSATDAPGARAVATASTVTSRDPPRPALPYGWDPARLRQLVDWIIDGREQAILPVAQRPAGDLNDLPITAPIRAAIRPVTRTEQLD